MAVTLADNPVRATAAVKDIEQARAFYEEVLGLQPVPGGPDAVRLYECGGGTVLQVYESPGNAGTSTATVASWSVARFDELIAGLLASGVTLQRYDGLQGDADGVHTFGDHKVAWFCDPDGNTFALDNGMSSM